MNPPRGKLFGETLFVVRPLVAKQPAQNRGYAVSRTYQKLGDDGGLQEATDLKVGDRLVVTLRIETARPGHFVAIDDPLPAILEAVNPAFKSRAVGGEAQDQDWVSDHREMRADRVLYFCDHLAPGSYTFRYLARVRMAGTVHAGPTKVEEMYRPERFGLGEAVMLKSQPCQRMMKRAGDTCFMPSAARLCCCLRRRSHCDSRRFPRDLHHRRRAAPSFSTAMETLCACCWWTSDDMPNPARLMKSRRI